MPLDSGTWKSMSNLKSLASQYMIKVIGNGENTDLWYDPWLEEGRLIELVGREIPIVTATSNWRVAHLISNAHWNHLLPSLSSVWEYILSVQIIGGNDSWRWKCTAGGSFSLKSAWNIARYHHANFALASVVWFPNQSPKMACCLLKGLLNRLPTKDRLLRFGLINSHICVLCENDIESRNHLFFKCPYTSYLWSLCKLKLKLLPNMGNLEEEAMKIKVTFTSKDAAYKLSRLALSCTVWQVWLERCRRIFQQKRFHKIIVFRLIIEDVTLLFKECNWSTKNREKLLANWSVREPD